MTGKRTRTLVITTTLAALAAGGVTLAAAAQSGANHPQSPPKVTRHLTPNDCIRLNGGDYNACNVGNSGRGDLPYRHVRG